MWFNSYHSKLTTGSARYLGCSRLACVALLRRVSFYASYPFIVWDCLKDFRRLFNFTLRQAPAGGLCSVFYRLNYTTPSSCLSIVFLKNFSIFQWNFAQTFKRFSVKLAQNQAKQMQVQQTRLAKRRLGIVSFYVLTRPAASARFKFYILTLSQQHTLFSPISVKI